MPRLRAIRSIGVEHPGQIYLFNYDEDAPPDGHFRIETLYTGLSAGTELTFYKGTNPYLHSHWDDYLGVFHTGHPSTQLPVPFLGYMEVGRVIESRTPSVEEGQVVCMAYGHKTGHTANPAQEFFALLPSDIPPILGIYVAQMGPICANGILHAAADWVGQDVRDLYEGVRGRTVLVVGAGVVGLLTGLFARLGGASAVVVADRTPERLEAVRNLGMIAVDENEIEAWRYCKERWHQNGGERGVDVVFQCRAQASSLQTALRSLRVQGTVIDLAFYQGGADEVRLGEEFHHNGLAIRCAQINRVPRGLAHRWTRRHLADATIDLLRTFGCEIRQHLITDIVPFNSSPKLFDDLAQRRRSIIQAVFKVFDE